MGKNDEYVYEKNEIKIQNVVLHWFFEEKYKERADLLTDILSDVFELSYWYTPEEDIGIDDNGNYIIGIHVATSVPIEIYNKLKEYLDNIESV